MRKIFVGLDDGHMVLVRCYPNPPREPFSFELDPCIGTGEGKVNHSPDGFSWGYGGSGPAQLAFAILMCELGPAIAHKYYQAFKERVIASLPQHEMWTLTDLQVRGTVQEIIDARGEAAQS